MSLSQGVYVSHVDEVRPFLVDKLVDHLGPPTAKGIAKIMLPREAAGAPHFEIDWLRIPRGGGVVEHHHRADGQREVYFVLKGTLRIKVEGHDDILLTAGGMVFFSSDVKHGVVGESPEAEYLAIGVPGKDGPRTDDVIEVLNDAGITVQPNGTLLYSELVRPEGHADRR
jgi:quercetin dioxygenase-like cupin family protein